MPCHVLPPMLSPCGGLKPRLGQGGGGTREERRSHWGRLEEKGAPKVHPSCGGLLHELLPGCYPSITFFSRMICQPVVQPDLTSTLSPSTCGRPVAPQYLAFLKGIPPLFGGLHFHVAHQYILTCGLFTVFLSVGSRVQPVILFQIRVLTSCL
jgi:hypothetical protein